MKRFAGLALALLVDVVGAGGALLLSLATWQRVTAARPRPFGDVTVGMTGRDVDSASTALALVALAGVVAVLATRGWWRRLVGGFVALAGAGLVWRGITASSAVGDGRARAFLESHRPTASLSPGVAPRVEVHGWWAVLSVGCGVLVLIAGSLVAVRGGRWQAMSARYDAVPPASPSAAAAPDAAPADGRGDAPTDGEARDAAAGVRAAALWSALDRGEDPTSGPTADPRSG
ncbi:trp region conserved hypothetical membrane protein [Jatrophihabitans endophyticus]|uniref:Trp region conserved hypothetical membrane protein n=1 Tax=Jatrophihabitans endophyticus TaxID=1206085 RepID=A0A1M5LGF4_9ACTN|nr:Trp biosynthesis-associated membrane protein [Jatrophihabitans endophyticus]SHG63749.1 trp region conserved hypothetical membrane protein [Jatrophihabitans endophyticus]